MKRLLTVLAAALLFLLSVVGNASADPDRRSERVHFAKGATSTVIKGQVKSDHYIDYQVRAGAGQALSVEMKTSNASSYFNILPPGSGDVAMFIGSTSGNRFSGVLPTDGDYHIRVYLMRNAARRNELANFTLIVGVTGQPLVATPAAKDALIPGTPFHASAKLACVPPFGFNTRECEAFVIRRGFDGTATVEVRWGEGLKRRILFVKGKPLAADSPEVLTAARSGDVSIVSFGSDERYEIPDAFLSGG
ncbi:MAG: hypothetical protein ACOYB3_13275 [Azonexus sp.]